MSKTVKPHWPDEVRLKMIEKSEFYSEPQIYQYGFYDGFQHAQSQTQELIEQNRELVDLLKGIVKQIEKGEKIGGYNLLTTSSIEYEYAQKLLTKYNHLKSKTNETDKI